MERKVFRSRISVLLIIILLPILLPLVMMALSGNIFNTAFYILVGTMLFIVSLFSGLRYEIANEKLIYSLWGMGKFNCPLSQIVSVERSYNPLSSPAASLKRLRIGFAKGYKLPYALISPAREQEFLDALKKANPDVYIRVDDKKGWWRIWDWDI